MANEEQDMKITINGEYKNINIKDLEKDNYFLLTKSKEIEKEGKYGKYYVIIAQYKGEDVSFFLNAKPGDAYKVLGGEGDTIKVTASIQENPVKKGIYYKTFKFDLI